MTMAENKLEQGPAKPGTPDPQRRALLRAAAVAPVVATIPTGAALANASAFQCVVSSKEGSDSKFPTLSMEADDPMLANDQWVRVPALQHRFVEVDPDDPEGGYLTYDLWRYNSTDNVWYDASGKQYSDLNLNPPTQGCDPNSEMCAAPGDDTHVFVLRIYQPVILSGDGPTGLKNPSNGPGEPFGYPAYSTTADRPSQLDNIGVYGSCFCSVSPELTPRDYCRV